VSTWTTFAHLFVVIWGEFALLNGSIYGRRKIMRQSDLADTNKVDGIPAVLDVPEAARLLGVGRTLAYQLVREGQWPTPVVRVGRLIKIPTGPLLELLGAADSRVTDIRRDGAA
jgi:excisionase family DNA binding protein